MSKVKYYKDTNCSLRHYAFKRMFNIFGNATPLERVAKYFNYPLWELQEWEKLQYIPDEEEAIVIIEGITKEKAEDFTTEKDQSIDFIINPH
jgi:hypothetical protein